DDPKRVGKLLFEALFPDDVRTCYDTSRAIVRDRGNSGLRIKLRMYDDLDSLPWELLYDPRDNDYLALRPDTALVRYVDAPVEYRALRVDGPLRVLLVAGWPDRLDLDAEIQRVRAALQPLIDNRRVALNLLPRASISALLDGLRRETYHVVHYLGHGLP